MVWLLRKSQARSWFYGLIVTQVTSTFLFLWFDCGVSFMVWLWCKSQARCCFYGLIVAEVASAFLVLWFDCGVSHKHVLVLMVWLLLNQKCVPAFMVWLWRKFYGLIVVQVTREFLVLWFDRGASHKRVVGFMVWFWCKSQARSWLYGLIVPEVTSEFLVLWMIVAHLTSAFLFLWFDCCASHKGVLGFMV